MTTLFSETFDFLTKNILIFSKCSIFTPQNAFWILKKSQNFEKIYFSSFQGKNIFFKDFFNVILLLIPGLLYKSVVTFLLNAQTKPWEGGKKSKKGPKGHFLPPCKFFIIAFSKKVKTLLYSKLGISSEIKLKKLSKTFVFPENLKYLFFRQLWVFFKTQRCIFWGKI